MQDKFTDSFGEALRPTNDGLLFKLGRAMARGLAHLRPRRTAQ